MRSLSDIKNKIVKDKTIECEYDVENTHRAVGTRLSHYVYKKFGNNALAENTVIVKLNGSAGQSLGAFLGKGIKIIVNIINLNLFSFNGR